MTKPTGWYAADKEGLRMLLERRGIEHALFELYQNADDTRATTITMSLRPLPGRPLCELEVVDDDPDGFGDLSHAYTLFAESGKKADPTKAGRFNLGEKLVLARCVEAEIQSTTGTVRFDANGDRDMTRAKRDTGTRFRATIRMTREEHDETSAAMRTLLVRPGLTVLYNDRPLQPREPVREFTCTLTTEIGGAGEPLRRTARKTKVRLYEPAAGEAPSLYELSCPVVSLVDGAVWHVQVMQRVPLNMERDNVTPAFLQELRVAVLNEMHNMLPLSGYAAPWVESAAADERVTPDAVEHVLAARYGDKRVGADPSDREAERTAAAHGYTVVQPLALSEGLRKRAKATGALTPAGRVFPTPRPFSDDPTAPPLKLVPFDKWTQGMHRLASYAGRLAPQLLDHGVVVQFANDITWPYNATYAKSAAVGGELTFNVGKLGHAFFERHVTDPEVTRLVLHELAHEFGHHLEETYHDGICRLGAKLLALALRDPGFFA